MVIRSLTTRQLVTDAILALGWAFLGLLQQYDGGYLEFIAALGMATALFLRRLSPALSLGVAWIAAVAQMAGGLPPLFFDAAIFAVLYSTSSFGSNQIKWLGLASSGVGAAVITVYTVIVPYWDFPFRTIAVDVGGGNAFGLSLPQVWWQSATTFFGYSAIFILCWTLGLLAKTWRTARETRRAQLLAEQNVVVEQERNRIARDMHDIVAHSLAVVIAQADGARYAKESDPGAVEAALTTIASTAREALGDVRLLLGQLRQSQEEGPQPVLADLARLFDQFGSAGLETRFEQSGEPTPLATGQQLAIYRIVQEALTNALRHGDTNHPAVVRFEWQPDGVYLTVTSAIGDSAPAMDSSLGHGIPGMRERAALVGGTATASAGPASFIVSATIPVRVRATA